MSAIKAGQGEPAQVPAELPAQAQLVEGDAEHGTVRRHRFVFALSAGWVLLMVACAVFANVLPVPGYDKLVAPSATPPFRYWPAFLGTDSIGRSEVSLIVYGARASLAISVMSAIIGLGVGTLLGLATAYFGGIVAAVVNLLRDALLAVPVLVLILAVAAVVTPSEWSLTVLLGVVSIPICQRIAHANVLAQLSRDYVLAARALGASGWRLLIREVLPNVANSLLAFGFLLIAFLMVFEGALDFLGVGIPPPTPSWGQMISAGVTDIQTIPYLVVVPSVVLMLTVLALNTLSDRLRERLDERWTQL
jgi:peptide/nickel transport system permease protein